MRFERDNSMSVAARIVYSGVRALPEFSEARAIVVAAAIAECRGRDVAGMRSLGGFSEVLRRQSAALPDRFQVNRGSKLIPLSVAAAVRGDIPEMRYEVQRALSTSGGAS